MNETDMIGTLGTIQKSATLWSKLPKWLRTVLLTISIITLVYWVGFLIYKILWCFRYILVFISDKKGYWIFISLFFFFTIVTLFVMQFTTNVKPFTQFANLVVELWNQFRSMLGSKISG